MKYILLFQHSCHACSEVARTVRALSVPGLEARSLQDPWVSQLLSGAGREVPDRPSLLIIDNDGVDVISGWAMRRRLAGIIGWRRAVTISRLAAAEGRARLEKLAGPSGRPGPLGPGRRKVIGAGLAAGLAGGLAWALKSPGPATAAGHGPGTGGSRLALASAAETKELLATAPVRQAISTWGPVSDAYRVSGGTRDYFILEHSRAQVVTFVGASSGAASSGKFTAWSLGPTPGSTGGYRIYLVDGTAITDTAPDGTMTAAYTTGSGPQDDPEISPLQAAQFIGCCGLQMGLGCISDCISCVASKGISPSCAQCTICAGDAYYACVEYVFGPSPEP
jgi:hypothetical protein